MKAPDAEVLHFYTDVRQKRLMQFWYYIEFALTKSSSLQKFKEKV